MRACARFFIFPEMHTSLALCRCLQLTLEPEDTKSLASTVVTEHQSVFLQTAVAWAELAIIALPSSQGFPETTAIPAWKLLGPHQWLTPGH